MPEGGADGGVDKLRFLPAVAFGKLSFMKRTERSTRFVFFHSSSERSKRGHLWKALHVVAMMCSSTTKKNDVLVGALVPPTPCVLLDHRRLPRIVAIMFSL